MPLPSPASHPMRIIHTEAATGFGGQEHRVLNEMLGMRDRGHQVEIICQPDSQLAGRAREAGFRVHTRPMDGWRNYIKGVLAIWRILRARQPHVVNTHSRRDTVIAALAARLAAVPLIVRTRHLARRPRSLWAYTGLPHAVIAVSHYVANQLLERGVAASRLTTVPDGVAWPHHRPLSTLRQELGLNDGDLLIGCVAHLRPQKGHASLLRALAPHLRARPHVHLVLAGAGSERASLETLARALDIAARTHFLGRRADVPNIMAGIDLFVLPTQFEALGTVFIEAALNGVPAIGTRVGGVPEVLKHELTGLLVPPDDTDALTAAIGALLTRPRLRRGMGQAAAAFVRRNPCFSLEGMAHGMECAYLDWLRARGISMEGRMPDAPQVR
ncbi:glycosyltransferase family 4 protein [Pseudomonadota bacterium AL_CKDN230030165-1A_HGKHYDSX7]